MMRTWTHFGKRPGLYLRSLTRKLLSQWILRFYIAILVPYVSEADDVPVKIKRDDCSSDNWRPTSFRPSLNPGSSSPEQHESALDPLFCTSKAEVARAFFKMKSFVTGRVLLLPFRSLAVNLLAATVCGLLQAVFPAHCPTRPQATYFCSRWTVVLRSSKL